MARWKGVLGESQQDKRLDALVQKARQPQPPPDPQSLTVKFNLKVKAAICSAQLLVQTLATVDIHLIKGDYDLAYYREVLEECDPILNSLCDRMEAAQAILRIEAERRCRKEG